jgi:hypothetical protein
MIYEHKVTNITCRTIDTTFYSRMIISGSITFIIFVFFNIRV